MKIEIKIGYINMEMTVAQASMFLDFLEADQCRLWENFELICELRKTIEVERKNIAAAVNTQLAAL